MTFAKKPLYHIALALSLLQTGSLPSVAALEGPVTLRQCYDWAKNQNEDLKIQQENINQSQARARSALGEAFPRVAWKLTNTWQEPEGVEKLEQQGFSGFVEKEQTESRFTVEQPLFSGFREFSARSGFKRESLRDRLLWERAAFDLFERTARAFYTVIAYETDKDNTLSAHELAEDRVKELRGFLRLGKARESEVFTAKAHAAALKARVEQAQAGINSAREELSFLTGQDLMTARLTDELPNPPAIGTLDEALAAAKNRTDIQAQREDVQAQRLRVRYERGYYWPTADLTGNYYTQRSTFLDEIDWDVVLAVDVPLFQGGKVMASVSEARAAYRQAKLRMEHLERRVLYDVRKTHGDLTAAIQEVHSMEEAAQAAQRSYNALIKEYRLGLVTNLDVLQALDFLQEQITARDAAQFKAKQLYIQLNIAMEKTL